jgi:hypothetical protein
LDAFSTLEPDDEGALIIGYWINMPLSTTACRMSERGALPEDEVTEREWLLALTLGLVEFDSLEETWCGGLERKD